MKDSDDLGRKRSKAGITRSWCVGKRSAYAEPIEEGGDFLEKVEERRRRSSQGSHGGGGRRRWSKQDAREKKIPVRGTEGDS